MAPDSWHVVHLTVLNPAQHPRLFWKMARTQAQAGYRVAVLGQDAATEPHDYLGVTIIPLPQWGRGRRLQLHRRIAQLVQRLQSQVWHVHTPELLPLALRLHGRVLYDVHEHYPSTLRAGLGYPPWLGQWLARRVERAEARAQAAGACALYADPADANRLGWPQHRWAVAENTFKDVRSHTTVSVPPAEPGTLRLVHSGTLAWAWGIQKSYALWQALSHYGPTELVYVGHAPQRRVQRWLQRLPHQLGHSTLTRVGIEQHVPYPTLQCWQASAHLLLAPYQPMPHLARRTPTKVYEALGLAKPLALTHAGRWAELNDGYPLGVPLRPEHDTATQARQIWEAHQAGWPQMALREPNPSFFWDDTAAPAMLALLRQMHSGG